MRALVVRLRGPMLSFGAPAIDKNRPTADHPGRSGLTGLFANALGWERTEFARHYALQGGLQVASRGDLLGTVFMDYQTVDLGQERLNDTGWTTRGVVQERTGSAENKVGTSIRHRWYRADAAYTVLVTVDETAGVSLDELEAALRHPKRPLFLGRACCPPSIPLYDPETPQVVAGDWVEAFDRVPLFRDHDPVVHYWLPADQDGPDDGRTLRTWDLADWANQAHRGTTREQTFSVEFG